MNRFILEILMKLMNIVLIVFLRGYCGAWFSGITGTKVDSLDCDLIDGLAKLHPNWQIVVEADGAKENGLRLLRRLSQSSHLSQRLRLVL